MRFQNKWFGLFDAGLNRTGKGCRLRWVNYLHPGLKHGRMTPQEERLILELHSEWGNRWSRIARRLPGRTDNEIKNYWRTHMRKRAQERKRNSSPSASSSSSCLSALDKCEDGSTLMTGTGENEDDVKVYPMDQIWNDIAASSESGSGMSLKDEHRMISCDPPPVASPAQDYFAEYLWTMDGYEFNMIPSMNDFLFLTA